MARRPGAATVLIESAVEMLCGLLAEERAAEEEYQRRRERLQRLQREARALAWRLTATYDQPQAAA